MLFFLWNKQWRAWSFFISHNAQENYFADRKVKMALSSYFCHRLCYELNSEKQNMGSCRMNMSVEH